MNPVRNGFARRGSAPFRNDVSLVELVVDDEVAPPPFLICVMIAGATSSTTRASSLDPIETVRGSGYKLGVEP